jgi:hypothetical protein
LTPCAECATDPLPEEIVTLPMQSLATSRLKHNWITALATVGNDPPVGTYGAGILRLGADGSVTSTEATHTGVIINPKALVSGRYGCMI